jgi:hypothetical protein
VHFGKVGSVQRANLVAVLTFGRDKKPLRDRAANKIGSVSRQNAGAMGTCVSRLKPYCSQVSAPILTILAPSLHVLPFDFRLVVILNPDDQSKSILTTIILITIRDEPMVRIESFGYGFTGSIAMQELFPFVTTNARRKAIGFLRDYIASEHSDLAANFALMEFCDGITDFSDWLTSALLGCSRECRQLFTDLKDKTQSQGLADFIQFALRASRESTIFKWTPS